ncbi:hypothetical protein [Nannocystis pusilla]|uniref:Uncharacterized protein n=1 Tax=Nannocystis pusilla TaxID=889268 RepID=A0ABS7U323_9BACT|nr:hypothetical protein [Nannocystis pusilla]MBZ5714922.1 hypothetical protein [Nannocystis pusilla]
MTVLQNKFYNGLTAALAASPTSFQLSVPAAPLPASDAGLWACLDVLPPKSLTFNRAQPASPYFAAYAAVVEQLEYAPSLVSVIGSAADTAWQAYLAGLDPPPSVCQQGPIFRTWAEKNGYSGVAVAGASNLAGTCLFEGQQQAVARYQGPNGLAIDFVGGYADLQATLAAAGPAQLAFDSLRTSSDVSRTWAGGQQLGLQGLWTGLGPLDALSARFAAGRVQVTATLTHYAAWLATPGGWYSSSLLNAAYSSQSTPPWPVGADPDWTDAFGPTGNLVWFLGSLAVGDGLHAVVTSTTSFTRTEQATIRAHAAQGMWPFYAPSSAVVTNAVSFDAVGHLTITTTSAAGNPFVLGGVVLGIAQYLGQAPG